MVNFAIDNVGMYTENATYLGKHVRHDRRYNTQANLANLKRDKSNNGKFDFSECCKNFVKGIFSPVKAIFKHPIATLGVLGGTTIACLMVPVLGPILTVGFGAYSIYQLGKGIKNTISNYTNGNYDQAEKSFTEVGEGVVGTALSVTGIKPSLGVVKEAKMMKELNVTSLTNEQRLAITNEIKNQKLLPAAKDLVKTLTSKDGWSAIASEFKPSMLKARISEVKKFITGNIKRSEIEETITHKRKMTAEEFTKTPEGIRRANLTDEQIEQEATKTMNEVFDKLGIKKELRPTLKIQKSGDINGGAYSQSEHEITFNPDAYKTGNFELEDVIMHEATHCREALIRAGIPKARAEEIVKEELISRIRNGESEEIILKGNLFGAEMMQPPKMSSSMQNDFIEFAKTDLYTTQNKDLLKFVEATKYYKNIYNENPDINKVIEAKAKIEPLLNKLQALINKHPEFAKQYSSEEEALEMLAQYSLSHNIRYNCFVDTGIKTGSFFRLPGLKVDELTGEELLEAEKSLRNIISTTEGNARISGVKGFFAGDKDFNQYQFSPEEVLAQQNGNEYLITSMTNKLNSLRESGELTPEAEATLTNVIEKAKKVIEFKTKGLDFYNKYTESINNPDNKELATLVESLSNELKTLKSQIDEYSFITVTETIKKTIYQRPSIALQIGYLPIIKGLTDIVNS